MLSTKPRLRIDGRGARLRVRKKGNWRLDHSASLSEVCRASIAIDKALVEAIARARSSGASWDSVGKVLGATDRADNRQDLIEALAHTRRAALEHLSRDLD
jgi:hypothetical protein